MNDTAGEHDPLASVVDAIAQADWDTALQLLDADRASPTAAGLELRAEAAYGAGDPEGSVAAWEALYSLHLAQDDAVAAARAASMVAMYLMIDTGLMSPIRGWLRRAERLIADRDETPVHAVVAMVRTYERLWCGDMEGAGINAARSIELGRRFEIPPSVLIGTVATARLRIFQGDIGEGLEMLDDVALTLASGDVDAMTSGMAYCELICAVQGLHMFELAGEWTRAMEHWGHTSAFGGFGGRCRVHRAELLRLSGPCDLAEAAALEACEELRPWMRREFGWPLTELGTIRLRKGDLAGAEEAFLAAHENCWTPQPGLALLRLAQGDLEAAASSIEDALLNPFDVPSKERPPHGGLRRAPLLDAQVEIAVAAGDVETARRAANELQVIADTFQSRALSAGAALAQARVALAEDDPSEAIREGDRALAAWIEVGAPFEAAVVRMTLGLARERCGNDEGARMEWQAAHRGFEAFGAVRWAQRAAAAAAAVTATAGTSPTPSPRRSTFRRDGDTRMVTFDGVTVLIHDLKGFPVSRTTPGRTEPGVPRARPGGRRARIVADHHPSDLHPSERRRRRSTRRGSCGPAPRRPGASGLPTASA